MVRKGQRTLGLAGGFGLLGVLMAAALAVAADFPKLLGGHGTLAGQFLIASPAMPDPRFAETVVYVIAHDGDGAMGLVINRDYGKGPLSVLLQTFGVVGKAADGEIRLHYGGPVEPSRGVVLHSPDYSGPSTRAIDPFVSLSSGRDVLEALAAGEGPRRRIFVLGYAGWGPRQLEAELAREDWMTAPADASLIFSEDTADVWDRARARAGESL